MYCFYFRLDIRKTFVIIFIITRTQVKQVRATFRSFISSIKYKKSIYWMKTCLLFAWNELNRIYPKQLVWYKAWHVYWHTNLCYCVHWPHYEKLLLWELLFTQWLYKLAVTGRSNLKNSLHISYKLGKYISINITYKTRGLISTYTYLGQSVKLWAWYWAVHNNNIVVSMFGSDIFYLLVGNTSYLSTNVKLGRVTDCVTLSLT